MSRQIKLSLISALLIPLNLSAVARTGPASPAPDKRESTREAAFQDAMRKLREDHITWTRVFIIGAAADLPDKDAAARRLLQNQVDIGNAVEPCYGDAAGEKLTTLLKEHITTAAEVVTAARANNTARMADANRHLFANIRR